MCRIANISCLATLESDTVSDRKKAVILASFGSSDKTEYENCLGSLKAAASIAFPDAEVFEAFTSDFIRKRIADAGKRIYSVVEQLQQCRRDGFDEVFVQPTHLTPGKEYYDKIVFALRDFVQSQNHSNMKVILGTTIFGCHDMPSFYADNIPPFRVPFKDSYEDDREGLAMMCSTLAPEKGEILAFMGHGSPDRHNPVYETLQRLADEEGIPVVFGVLEKTDTPSLDDMICKLHGMGAKRVLLRPMLLTSGLHVKREMLGDDKESFKSRLQHEGFELRTDDRGLASYPAYSDLLCRHIRVTYRRMIEARNV